jgi:hypothetical protein
MQTTQSRSEPIAKSRHLTYGHGANQGGDLPAGLRRWCDVSSAHDRLHQQEEMEFMSKMFVFAGVALGALYSFSAGAVPLAPPASPSASNIIQVAEGCGRGEHREHGRCVNDHRHEEHERHRVCPPHWHFSEFRDRCVHD